MSGVIVVVRHTKAAGLDESPQKQGKGGSGGFGVSGDSDGHGSPGSGSGSGGVWSPGQYYNHDNRSGCGDVGGSGL